MKRFPLWLGLPFAVLSADGPSVMPAAPLPPGYQLVYEQHFDSPDSLSGFAFTDPAAWKWSADGQSHALELAQQSRYEPKVRSPVNLALIADRVFGDFVLEADLIQTGKEYGHRDLCLFYGVQDAAHFYYTHIATKADPNAHNTFIVNGAPRKNFASETTAGVNWGLGVWHHVRLERRTAEGTIRVFFDDMTKPIMQAEDKTFGPGWIGFGSFDDTGKVDNVRIWSPTEPEQKAVPFFKRWEQASDTKTGPVSTARLTEEQALRLAMQAAKLKGVTLETYKVPEATFYEANWRVWFQGRVPIPGHHFCVEVNDRTEATQFYPGR